MSRKKFTPEEDQQLRTLVEVNGFKDWKIVSSFMQNRTARQCRERYNDYLNPALNKGEWTIDEEKKLIELIQQYGKKWSFLKKFFNGRSDVNLKNHWPVLERKLRSIQTVSKTQKKVTAKMIFFDSFIDDDDDLWMTESTSPISYMM